MTYLRFAGAENRGGGGGGEHLSYAVLDGSLQRNV